jgi:hypothetical protein
MKKFKRSIQFVIGWMIICAASFAQPTQGWQLDKMPDSLEFQYALSALPPHLRNGATVYLLDPEKGYYMARQGTNGFSTFINRTEFEWTEFIQDSYAAISYDSAGSKVYLRPYFDVAAMRATGKYTLKQIRDTVVQRVKNGTYKPASRVGISYMLSPIRRVPTEGGITNMVMPHYMFYAPYLDNNDIGGGWVTGGYQPFVVNNGTIFDKAHSIFNYIIIAAGETEKAKIIQENQDLLERLEAYKSYFKIETSMALEHHHPD